MSETVIDLCVGFDLGSEYSQVACYNDRRDEVDSICLPGKRSAYEIPTRLCKSKREDKWLFGEETESVRSDAWIVLKNFLKDYDTQPKFAAGGRMFDKKELLFIFVSRSLELIWRYYPHGKVRWLTFTSKEFTPKMREDLISFAPRLELDPSCIWIQTHIASYENYVLCQPKEIWAHDVGAFEYDDAGLSYYHLNINHRRSPVVVTASALDLNAYMSGSDYRTLSPEQLDKKFQDVVKEVLGKRTVTAVFLVGHGFSKNWMDSSLKTMCTNRKGFIGQNMYASGAAYSSMLEAKGRKNKEFVAISEDIIPVSIYVQMSYGRENRKVDLAAAGTQWYHLQEEVEFILDGTDTIPLRIRDYVTNKEILIPVKPENLPVRPNRTTRLKLRLSFESSEICLIELTDLGFGSFFPPSGKIWKRRYHVTEYEGDRTYVKTGRLILSRRIADSSPFYFQVSGMKVYSLEELCYYISENIYAVNLEMFGEDLLFWMERDMEEPVLANGIRNILLGKGTLRDVIRYLMNYIGYFQPEECQQLLNRLDELALQNPVESKKRMADNYVRYSRYLEAIRTYHDVIYDMEHGAQDDVTREFKGNTWHNLGVAYTRVMNFEAALDCFQKASAYNHSRQSLENLLLCAKLLGDETTFFDTAKRSGLDQSELEELVEEFDQVEADSRTEKNERMRLVNEIAAEKTHEGYVSKRDAYLRELKDWYRS